MILPLFIVLFGLMALGVYIFAAMGLSALAIIIARGIPLTLLPQTMVGGVDAFSLLAIPFYMLTGDVMNRSGITARLVQFSKLIVGHLKGGLAYVEVLADTFAAGVSGSAVADAAAIASVMMPTMKRAGYRLDFSAAINAASSTIGGIIPPSIPLIFVALITEQSVAHLFVGGIGPGLLMVVALMVVLAFMIRHGDFPPGERVDRSPRVVFLTVRDGFFALMSPVVILVGIVGGLVTIVEASMLAATYVLFVGLFIFREIRIQDLPTIFMRTAVFSSTILIIFAAIGPWSWIMASERVAHEIVRTIVALDLGREGFLLVSNVMFLILGMVLDGLILILLLLPILLPVAVELGIHPVHFSVVMVVNLAIGLITPPMGALLFVLTRISGVPYERIALASLPFIGALLVVLILVTYIDAFVLTLPSLLLGP